MKQYKKYIAAVAVTVFLLAAAIVVPKIIKSSVPEVTATRVVGENIADTVKCSGTVEGKSSKNLYTASGIMIDKVYVKNGQQVKKGDLLFSVNKSATVSLWKSTEEKADSNSGEEVSNLLDGLIADYFTSSVSDVFSAFAEEESAEGGDNSSELLVIVPDFVTASIDGVVANVNIEDGVYADGKSPLLQICDTSSLFVRCKLSENFAKNLKKDLRCNVSGEAFDGTYTAKVSEVSPVADSTNGGRSTLECLVEIDFPDSKLKAGYSADAEIVLKRKSNALTVPYSAVCSDEDGDYVWVLYGSRPYRRSITLGIELDDTVEIEDGIDSGSLVITSFDSALKEGCLVEIKSGE